MADAATAAVLPHAAAANAPGDATNSAALAATVGPRRTTTGVAQTAARQRHHFQQGRSSTVYHKSN